jgi:hypothetical protein
MKTNLNWKRELNIIPMEKGIEHHNLDKYVAIVLRLGFGFCISSFARLWAASKAARAPTE